MRTVSKILSIVILMTGFISCSKMDRVFDGGQTEIAMRPVMSSMSKAPVTGTAYPSGETFGVIAYNSSAYGHDEEWVDLSGEKAPVIYLDKQKFQNIDNDTFGGVTPCYWPYQGSLVFAGYSPFEIDGLPSFNPSTQTLQIGNFLSGDGQTDLMYFLPEVRDGNLVGLNSGASSVPVAFSHALALLEFNVYGLEKDETIKITKVTVSGWRSRGNFSVTVGNDPSWIGTVSNGTKDVYTNVGEEISHTTPVTIHALTIPGATTDITITYDVHAAATHTGKTVTINAAEIAEFSTWATGKKYIYNITLASKFIVVDPSVGDYNETDRDVPTLG